MTRSELIQIVSTKQSQLSDKEMELAVRYVFDQMTDALGSGKRIEIRGFGSFSIRFRAARMARNLKRVLMFQRVENIHYILSPEKKCVIE